MNLFTKKEVPTVVVDPIENLQTQSEAAISIFSQTITRLTDANFSVEVEEEKELAAKAAIEVRLKTLSMIKTKNENFIGKINQLFE